MHLCAYNAVPQVTKLLDRADRGGPAASAGSGSAGPLPELPKQTTPGPGAFDLQRATPWVKASSNVHTRVLTYVVGNCAAYSVLREGKGGGAGKHHPEAQRLPM